MLQLTAPAPIVSVVARLRAGITPVLVGVATIFLILVVTRNGGLVEARLWHLRLGRLAGATLGEVVLLAWGVRLWSGLLSCFAGPHPGYRGMLCVWWASTVAKYIPGSVWSLAVTADMAARVGASPVALSSSFLLQAVLNFVGALTLAVLAQPSDGQGAIHVPTWVAALLVGGVLVLVHPRVLNALVRLGGRVSRRDAPTWNGTWLRGATFLVLYVATWVGYGVTFALFLSGITPIGRATWIGLVDANALAFGAGFLAFFAPGGVGVREAALVVLLAPFIPGRGARVAIAASSRLWLILTEALGIALAVVVERHGSSLRRWRPARLSTAYPRAAGGAWAPSRVTLDVPLRGSRVELLTNTEHALRIMTDACRGATHSIWISQLAFDADCVAPGSGSQVRASLLDAILHAARRASADGTRVDVRIVLNGGLLLDTSPALRRAIALTHDGGNVRVRTVKAFPQVMHAKLLLIDHADAFVMGSSFVNGYWDCARHTAAGDPEAAAGCGDRPLHDVAVRVQGPAASTLAHWFAPLWAAAAPASSNADADDALGVSFGPSPRIAAQSDFDTGASAVRILRTIPSVGTRGAGRTEILDAYLDAIARATDCIYLESQYFSARPIAQAVRAALDAHAELEVILVINQNPDVTAYRAWQNARLAEHGLLGHARVGVFGLWSTAASRQASGRTEITQVFVHSKVAVIDDAWATLGTANLDGASLHSYGDDFAGWVGRRVFGRYRNYDLNVELFDGADGDGSPADLRCQLWAQHLGVPEVCLRSRPQRGWLDLWRTVATTNVKRLAAGGCPRPVGRALPYVVRSHPREQLRALGIDLDAAGLDLRFDPGRVEVLFSPGWMKKVLPGRLRSWLNLT